MIIRKRNFKAGIDWLHSLLVARLRAEFGVITFKKAAKGYEADTDNIVNATGAEVIGGALVIHTDRAAATVDILSLLNDKHPAIVKVADCTRHRLVFDITLISGRIVFAVMEG